jgi:biotin transport system substrate-specific component
MNKKTFSTTSLVLMALFVAILSASAYVSIPIGTAHITLLNFIILLIGMIFPLQNSVIIVGIWMIMGAVGIPVFVGGNASLGYLLGPLGGYTVSFLVAVIFLGLTRGKDYSRIRYTIIGILAAVIIDLIGTAWWKFAGNISWGKAFIAGFLPFILLDLIKAVVAAQIVPAFRKIINN